MNTYDVELSCAALSLNSALEGQTCRVYARANHQAVVAMVASLLKQGFPADLLLDLVGEERVRAYYEAPEW